MKTSQILEKIHAARANLEFMKTGFAELDADLDGGFIKQELVVIGAFTGIGKSFLSGQMMLNIARQGFKTAYFSLEISNEMIVSRLIGQMADIKSIRVVKNDLMSFETEKKLKAEGTLIGHEAFMDFYDDVYEFEKIVKIIRDSEAEFVVIDFIQNIIVKGMEEYERLSYVSLRLQQLAKEKNCCILILSQLSNSVARDVLGSQIEYKGSGGIATVCDLGFFLVRDSVKLENMTLSLKKNRRGPSGKEWPLAFSGEGGLLVVRHDPAPDIRL